MASHLGSKEKASSDISDESMEFATHPMHVIRDLSRKSEDDNNRIAGMQLAKLFEEIAPDNYKSRQWGELRRTLMIDNTHRWLCDDHAKKMGK